MCVTESSREAENLDFKTSTLKLREMAFVRMAEMREISLAPFFRTFYSVLFFYEGIAFFLLLRLSYFKMTQKKKRKTGNMRFYLTYYSIVNNIDMQTNFFKHTKLNASLYTNNIFAINCIDIFLINF